MWNDTDSPLAYFISFRSYGTWLHGDKRGAIDRAHNRYRTPYLPSQAKWLHYNEQQLKTEPLIPKARHRKSCGSSDSGDLRHPKVVPACAECSDKSRP
jgi:hypothetical protein